MGDGAGVFASHVLLTLEEGARKSMALGGTKHQGQVPISHSQAASYARFQMLLLSHQHSYI